MKKEQIRIVTDSKELIYSIEIPETDDEFFNGLAFRDFIPEKTGMIYDYHDKIGEYPMYTPDTRIPVDFIFADEEGRILKISTAKPLSKEVHKSKNTALVLEINGGEAKKFGIQVGDTICCSILKTEKSFNKLLPIGVDEFVCYDRQFFAKLNGKIEWMYSYAIHFWIKIPMDDSLHGREFQKKFEGYKTQGIAEDLIEKDRVSAEITRYENAFKNSFRETKSDFFQYKREFVFKVNLDEDKYYMYTYGKGWEEIEWWENKKDLMIGIQISCIKISNSEAEEIIKLNEKKEDISAINNRNNEFIGRPDFMGEHGENLGSVWGAFGVIENHEEYINELGSKMIYPLREEGKLSKSDRIFLQYMQIVYHKQGITLGYTPKVDEDFKMTLLLRNKEKSYEFLSGYPIMNGCKNEVTIEGKHLWKSGCEGVFVAKYNDMTSVSWFDPFYMYDQHVLKINQSYDIMFSALALDLEESESNIITITKGGFYEVRLEEFLKENPGKSPKDMPPVEIETARCTMLIPSKYVGEYEYQTEVLSVNSFEWEGNKVYKMEVEFLRDPEYTPFKVNLYAFDTILNGYEPQKGDYIRGVLWLQGHSVIKK